ncbi:glycosyltransferase family 4 protein [Roseateles sp. So40a]|uniref:glycosyltransferase family 4 protein n=1 Tax=Roseateles sp. So40a TaxID=3400226 RepID=UPI003A86BADE
MRQPEDASGHATGGAPGGSPGQALHIAHVLLTDRFAGSERYAIDLANLQAPHHRVTMILTRSAGESRPDALAHRLDPRVDVQFVDGWAPLRMLAVRRRLRALRPDVAHGHLSWANRALNGWRGEATMRVSTLHIRYKGPQQSKLDGVIAIAPWQLEDLPASLPHVQIDNWSEPRPPRDDARAQLRRSLGMADDEVLFGALGRVEESKGLDVLIEAWQRARPARARLVIVGHGRDWERLRRMAPPDIVMPGFAERPQDWMSAFDVFVSAARSEPFGLVFLEAMYAGLPILASDSEGASHLSAVIDTPLLPRGDVGALAQALDRLACTRPPRRGYELSRFDAGHQAARIEAFYRELLAGARLKKPR